MRLRERTHVYKVKMTQRQSQNRCTMHTIYCLPLAKRFREKGYQEDDKTVAMAPLGFLNEDVETAGSTKDIRVYYIYQDSHSIAKLIISPLNIAIAMAPVLS